MKRSQTRLSAAVIVIAVVLVYNWWQQSHDTITPPGIDREVVTQSDDDVVAQAFRERRSGLMVTLNGTVERTLADDREGSPHQRFILELNSGQTVLVAHNLDLAERVPLDRRERVTVRGQYEWNERGGIVHWTHHDPKGRRDGGWIKHGGQVYR